MRKLLAGRDGTSMLFAMVLFVIMTVFGVSLLNAVSANVADSRKQYEKEQTLLYVSSLYDIVNEMIEKGKFSDGDRGIEENAKANAVVKDDKGEDIDVKVTFKNIDPIEAKVEIGYGGDVYSIKTYYDKNPTGGGYTRKYCGKLEKKK